MLQGEFEQVYRFYYTRLSREQKQGYDLWVKCILERKEQFELPVLLTEEGASQVYEAIKNDYPLFFFLKNYIHSVRNQKSHIRMYYRILEENIQPMLDQILEKAREFAGKIVNLSEEEKELAIHDYLATKVTYEKDKSYFVHQIIGVFLHEKAVCEGIARAAKLLFDLVGMRSVYVTGYGNCLDGAEGGPHAWNVVYLKDTPYYLDITFDNSKEKNKICYEYYNMSDEQLARNHRVNKEWVNCPQGGDYFTVRGWYADNRAQMKACIQKQLSEGKKEIALRVSFTKTQEEWTNVLKEVLAEIQKENPSGRWQKYYFKRAQHVIYVEYK